MLRGLHIATCVAALQKPLMIGKQSVVRSTATADVAQEVATVDLTDLLSTCVDACERGCAEIRRVAAQLDRNNEGGVRQVDYKIAGDPRSALTAADLAAQLAVVEPLATAWPGLRIVGEEDLACDVGAAADGAVCASPLIEVQPVPVLRRDRCDGLRKYASIAQEERRDIVEASLERVTVFVDPLDGTREFVEGRLENVQCLVGVAVDGRAVAGAVGLPFGGVGGEAVVVYGLVGAGVATTGPRSVATRTSAMRPLVAAGDTDDATLRSAYAAARGTTGENVLVGGTGTKILAVVDGFADVAVMNFKSSSWDTCAPEAVLRAAGGRLTDIFGENIAHVPEPADPAGVGYLNALGAVATGPGFASAHDAVRAAMVRDAGALKKLEPWGADVEAALAARRAALFPR